MAAAINCHITQLVLSMSYTVQNFFLFGFGVFYSCNNEGMFLLFWPTLPDPGRQPTEAFFWLKLFWKLVDHPCL